MARFKDVGIDAPQGPPGTGTPVAYRFDLLPPHALAAVAAVMKEGAEKYGEGGWREGTPAHNVNKALIHIYAYLAGDDSEEGGDPEVHMDHALTRLAFAVDMLHENRLAKQRSPQLEDLSMKIEINNESLEYFKQELNKMRSSISAAGKRHKNV